MERNEKIFSYLLSTDPEMVELGIILALQQGHEWCKENIPWNGNVYDIKGWKRPLRHNVHEAKYSYHRLHWRVFWRGHYFISLYQGSIIYRYRGLIPCYMEESKTVFYEHVRIGE